MTHDGEEPQAWPTHCPSCGTRLRSGVIDFDKSNPDSPIFHAGEMAAVDYCPNVECPEYDADLASTAQPDDA